MKNTLILCLVLLNFSCAYAPKTATISEREPAEASDTLMGQPGTSYEVLFTDPECKRYTYANEIVSRTGTRLMGKPKNVYCQNKNDLVTSGNRKTSPQYRLVEWIKNPETKEIFFTYLSFRNKAVKNALCDRVKKGDLRVTFVISSSEDTTAADELVSCNPDLVQYKTRGLEGGLGYAHNKIFIALKKQLNLSTDWRSGVDGNDDIGIVFSSGNMTSGPVMHHENWHFIKTKAQSYFAQMHLCVLNSEWDDKTGRSRASYMNAISKCRRDLVKNGFKEESDIRAFFVPGEGEGYNGKLDSGRMGRSAWDYMNEGDGINPGIQNADRIWIGAHRFFYSNMINALNKRMYENKKPDVRIVVDDDTYYKAVDPNYSVGDTDPAEWYKIDDLVKKGAHVRLMETNPGEHQLHHSKYLLFFKGDQPAALLCGAANLTGAGFKKNWENIYYITIPEVLEAFKNHYEKFWISSEGLKDNQKITSKATPVNGLPEKSLVADDLNSGSED